MKSTRKICRTTLGTIAVLLMTGCVLPKEKKQMQTDIIDNQARLEKLEQSLDVQSKDLSTKGDTANKRIASTQANLDRFNLELQKMRGEIDTLRIGVITGQLPGMNQETDGSIAAMLRELSQRVESLENSQQALLDAIKKAGIKKVASRAKSRKKMDSVDQLQKAFDQRKYLYVAEDAESVEKKSKGDEKTLTQYLHAESLYKLGRLRDAALKFNDFLDSKPSKEYIAPAKLRMGDSFRHLGEMDAARLYYDEIISDHPESPEAKTAAERIADMGGGSSKG